MRAWREWLQRNAGDGQRRRSQRGGSSVQAGDSNIGSALLLLEAHVRAGWAAPFTGPVCLCLPPQQSVQVSTTTMLVHWVAGRVQPCQLCTCVVWMPLVHVLVCSVSPSQQLKRSACGIKGIQGLSSGRAVSPCSLQQLIFL